MGSLRKRGEIWWMQYYRDGRRYEESARTRDYETAKDQLATKEGDGARGKLITPKMGRLLVPAALAEVARDYRINRRKSLSRVEAKIENHLSPHFGAHRMTELRTADVREYIEARQAAGAEPATINRELAILKRAFTLAIRGGLLLVRPHIPMLKEANARKGFFERADFEAVCGQLHEDVAAVVRFAYLTGWRVASEVLPLQWRQVDWVGQVVRLDPYTTKNDEGRAFPFTTELRALLDAQRTKTQALQRANDQVIPWVFHRSGRRIKDLSVAFENACRRAGVPGRLLHDFRRTAVRALERASVPRSTAMAMVGHKTESIYRRYAIVDERSLREAAARLDAVSAAVR